MSRAFKIAFILVVSCMASSMASAQDITIGEKAPKIVATQWLGEANYSAKRYTCIIFVHSHNATCVDFVREAVENVRRDKEVELLILTREDGSIISPWLREIRSERVSVAVNADDDFERYQVKYAPFAVTLDPKRRVVWFGNPERASFQVDAAMKQMAGSVNGKRERKQ